jgi:S1-C subfamily serine protease
VAFAVSENLVVTSADVVAGAKEIRVQGSDGTDVFSATIEKTDDASGLALLKLDHGKLAALPVATAFSGGAVTCIGFPEVSLFDTSAQLIAGSAKPTGVASFARHPRLAGAPLLVAGQVVGVALGSRDQEQTAISIATLQQLQQLMSDVSVTAKPATDPRAAVMQLTAVRSSQ